MSDDPQESNKIAVDVSLKYAHFMQDWTARMRCQHFEDLDDFLAQLRSFIMERLFPTLMSYDTPEKVLTLYLKKNEKDRTSFDPPSWSGISSALTALILARLHVPEHYTRLKKRYVHEFEGLDSDKLERSNRLIQYLDKSDPLPALQHA
jgi:hypothetical protein